MSDSQQPERGMPCPECKADGRVVRLNREFSHWCTDAECQRFHVTTTENDRWVCPVKPDEHAWDEADYRNRLEERKGA